MTTNNFPGNKPAPPAVNATGTRPAGLASKVQLRAGTADAVLAVVPHLLGFYPSRSLVVLGLGERDRVMVTFRYDLPDPPDSEVAGDIAEHAQYVLNRERISAAVMVGYGPDDLVAPVIIAAARRLGQAGVDLREALLADSGRFWSLLCTDPDCCPPQGRPYDPGSHPAAAAMSSAGLTVYPDRDALARTLQRPAGAADRIARVTAAAQSQLAELQHRSDSAGDRDPQLLVTRVGRKAVQRAVKVYRSGGSLTGTGALTWLAVLLADLRVRDDAWARMDPAHHDDHCRLWTDVIRNAAQDYVAGPASLLAFTAWQAGNGALAAVAIDRALRADPDYSMAQLLARAVEAALPPSAAQMPMSPAAVAASYARPQAELRGRGPGVAAGKPARRRRRPASRAVGGGTVPGGRGGRPRRNAGNERGASGEAGPSRATGPSGTAAPGAVTRPGGGKGGRAGRSGQARSRAGGRGTPASPTRPQS